LVEPLVWNKQTGNLVGGHQRLKVLKEQGAKEVEVSVVDLSGTKEKALNIALNKAQGDWDFPKLKDLLQELDTGEFDINITGFDEAEIEELVNQLYVPDENEKDDDVPEVPEEPVTKLGDLYRLGEHRLLCGDATSVDDVERLVDGQKADMVFTDPPYNVGYKYIDYKDNKTNKEYLNFVESFYNNLNINIKDGAAIYIMSGDKFLPELGVLFKKIFRFSQILFWVKDNPTLGNSDYQYNYEAILYGWKNTGTHKYYGKSVVPAANLVNRDTGKDKTIHKAQRPVKLVCDYINNSSKTNQIILDIFGGSGSTLIACQKLNRKCYMMELDPHYCDVIVKRWEDYTGKKAELDGKTRN
jgi:DNA modification methylase